MNKSILLSLIVLLLAGVVWFVANKEEKSTDSMSQLQEERDFTLKDESKLAAFRITKPNGEVINLKKVSKDHWILNDTYPANMQVVETALNTFENYQLKYIPTKQSTELILEGIKKNGILIEYIDDGGKVFNKYLIGAGADKGTATYMLRSGYDQPFAMSIKGFDGIVRSRFDHNTEDWRSLRLFDFADGKIDKIVVDYSKDKENSFEIVKNDGHYEVKPLLKSVQLISKPANASILNAYLKDYGSLYAEGLENKNSLKDSLMNVLPFATINVVTGNEEMVLKFIPVLYQTDHTPNPSAYQDAKQINRYYTSVNDKDLFLTQQYVVGKYFMSYRGFFK